MAVKVQITGFQPFGEHSENITEKIVDILQGNQTTIQLGEEPGPMAAPQREIELNIDTRLLTVDESGSRIPADALVGKSSEPPEAVVLLGMSAGVGTIRIEETAYNELNFSIPDNSGRISVDSQITESGHRILHSTAPINLLKQELTDEENISFSTDPGRFVCNETYFRTLLAGEESALTDRHGRAIPIVFVHIDCEGVTIEEAVAKVQKIAAITVQRPHMQVVGGMLRDCDNRLLAARRGASEYMGGYWEFPGGKVEKGETKEEAIVREYKEEFSWDVTPVRVSEEYSHAWPEMVVHLTFFLCETDGELPPAVMTSHDENRWLAEDELLSVDWLPPDVEFVRGLQEKGVGNL